MNLIVDVGRLLWRLSYMCLHFYFCLTITPKSTSLCQFQSKVNSATSQTAPTGKRCPSPYGWGGWKKLSALVKMWNLLGLSNLWWTIVSSVGWKNINVVLLYCLDMSVENTCLPKKLKILHKMWVQISD